MDTSETPGVVTDSTTVNHGEYLMHTRKEDNFAAEANDLASPGLTYLRIEMARVRVGMGDYLMKVATPKIANVKKSNQIITLRCSRKQATPGGNLATAKTIIAEMKKRGDATTSWDKVDAKHLSVMLAPSLKFFSANSHAERLNFSTEALS